MATYLRRVGAERLHERVRTISSRSAVWNLGIGAAIGYCSSRAMDQATSWYLERQSQASRRREEEVAPGGAPVLVGKKLAGVGGREVTDEQAARIGSFVHRSLGMIYGMAAAALARTSVPPLRAGVATGAAAFVVVDEGVLSVFFTPPAWAYPLESHLRGVVGHLAYGTAAGMMLSAASWLGAVKR
jgi:hypothetical protein